MHHGAAGAQPLDPLPYIQRLSLSLAVTINWGVRIASTTGGPLFGEIVAVEEELNRFRSTTGNLQDYVPLLRVLNPRTSARARDMRDRRDAYLATLNGELAAKVREGSNKPCIQASVLTYKDAPLSATELTSISLSMLGGGF